MTKTPTTAVHAKPAPTEAPDMTKQYRSERRELQKRLRTIGRRVDDAKNRFNREAKKLADVAVREVRTELGSRAALQKRLAIIEGRLSAS